MGAGAGAGAVDLGVGEVRRGVVRGAVVFVEGVAAPASSVESAVFVSTSSGSLVLFAVAVVPGTVIAIGALDDTGSALPLELLLRSASAIPPPTSAATSTTPIQTAGPMPEVVGVRGGGIEGIRAACAGACGAIAAEGNIERSMPAFCDQGLAPCGGG